MIVGEVSRSLRQQQSDEKAEGMVVKSVLAHTWEGDTRPLPSSQTHSIKASK